jgi:hypothetical protein
MTAVAAFRRFSSTARATPCRIAKRRRKTLCKQPPRYRESQDLPKCLLALPARRPLRSPKPRAQPALIIISTLHAISRLSSCKVPAHPSCVLSAPLGQPEGTVKTGQQSDSFT